ncbi:MAG TPA: hypothetical protein VKH83_14290 [Methylomirabilota bacterium]|nr:hypothetical protein [Methylomirabilota bacterium]
MMRLSIAVGLCAAAVLLAGQAEAQYRYTDDKGVSKTAQYKLDVPMRYRESAVWIGPTGVGKPALSQEQNETRQRWDIYRRIGESVSRRAPAVRRVEAVETEKCR